MKVTEENYFDFIEKVGEENLSADMKEMHEFVLDSYQTGEQKKGSGWYYYEHDPGIRELIDAYFNLLSTTYAKVKTDSYPEEKKAPSESKKRQPEKGQAKEKEYSMPDPALSKYKQSETVYLVSDGTEVVVDSVHVPVYGRKHKYYYNLLSSNGKLFQNIPEEELTNEPPERSNEEKAGHRGASQPFSSKKEKIPRKSAKGYENETEEEEEITSLPVEMVSPEIAFIREWVSINGKVKPINKLAGFLNRLQLAIVEKRVRRDAPFANEFMEVQRSAIKLHKDAENSRRKEVLIETPAGRLAELAQVAGMQHLMPTVKLIKAYMRLMGKPIAREKVINLHNRIKKAADKGVFTSKDPYIKQISHIIKSLETFAKTKKHSGILEIHPAQLNGLQGILESCGCHELHGLGDVADEEDWEDEKDENDSETEDETDENDNEPEDEDGDNTPKSMSSEEAATRKFILLNFDDPRFSFIGNPSSRFVMMVYGEPGSGKTTFLLQFAKYLAENFGRVLYVTPEEYDSPTLTMMLNRLDIRLPSDKLDFAEYIQDKDPQDYDFIFIDSVNDHDLTYPEFREIRKKYRDKAFIPVFQMTKGKEYRGVSKWKHKADLSTHIASGKITVDKSRFGSLGNTADVPGFAPTN